MSSPEPVDSNEYLERIERHFGLRRGGRLMLSPRDWQLVQSWWEQSIPLATVLRGINRAFDRFEASPRTDRINSLSYCAQQVAEVREEEREIAASDGTPGRDDRAASDGPTAHLRHAAAACRAHAAGADPALAERLDGAAAKLEALAAAYSAGEVGARSVDADAGTVENEIRALEPGLFGGEEPATDTRPDTVPLPRFSPWAV